VNDDLRSQLESDPEWLAWARSFTAARCPTCGSGDSEARGNEINSFRFRPSLCSDAFHNESGAA
jgi:hypothetical protein